MGRAHCQWQPEAGVVAPGDTALAVGASPRSDPSHATDSECRAATVPTGRAAGYYSTLSQATASVTLSLPGRGSVLGRSLRSRPRPESGPGISMLVMIACARLPGPGPGRDSWGARCPVAVPAADSESTGTGPPRFVFSRLVVIVVTPAGSPTGSPSPSRRAAAVIQSSPSPSPGPGLGREFAYCSRRGKYARLGLGGRTRRAAERPITAPTSGLQLELGAGFKLDL